MILRFISNNIKSVKNEKVIIHGSLNFAFAGHQQEIPMQIFNNGAASQGPTYAPPRPWYIVQDDYVLTLPALADDYTFELRDEEDEVVYTTFLPSGTTLAF